jgi:hypothetical protein
MNCELCHIGADNIRKMGLCEERRDKENSDEILFLVKRQIQLKK